MKRFTRAGLLGLTLVLGALALSCSKPSAAKPDTPEVAARLSDLRQKLDPDRLGYSSGLMRAYVKAYAGYASAREVQAELDAVPEKLGDQFTAAKDRARGGDPAKAEAMLRDLADCFPGEDVGRRAARELQYDFPFLRAQMALVAGDLDGAEVALRGLQGKKLSETQAETVDQLLDSVAVARSAEGRTLQARAMAQARAIHVFLAQRFAEEGAYPTSLTFDDLKRAEGGAFAELEKSCRAVESYSSDGRTYRMVLVLADVAGTKIEFTDSTVPTARK
jgi:hypothetical protein